jgi:hypothetical protein
MRHITTLLIFLFVGSAYGQEDAITKYFNQYRDDDRFTMVSINKKMFELIANVAEEDVDNEVLEMISKMDGLKILTTEDQPRSFYKEAISTLNTKEYEELMTVRDKDQDIRFMVKDSDGGKIVDELLLLVGGDDEFVFLSFVGKIYLSKIGKLAKSMDIDGIEHLDKLDK